MVFRLLDHTADVKIEAEDGTLGGVFGEAAKGLTSIMCEEVVRPDKRVEVSLRAENRQALFFDFLSELVYLLDTEGLFVCDAKLEVVEEENGFLLRGELLGDLAEHYVRSGDVKAPTMHDLVVEQTATGWLVRATMDI